MHTHTHTHTGIERVPVSLTSMKLLEDNCKALPLSLFLFLSLSLSLSLLPRENIVFRNYRGEQFGELEDMRNGGGGVAGRGGGR